MSASTTTTSDSIKRELQATLAARQDVGPGYDDHFLDSIVDRLKAEVAQELRRDVRPQARPILALTTEQRLKVAIASLVVLAVLLFLGALSTPWDGGMRAWCFIVGLAVVLINVFLNLRLRLKS